MRMNAVLSNPKHPEYGQFTVPLPIPHNQYDGIMEALNAMDMGDPLARENGKKLSMKDVEEISWRYAREVEHSDDNLNALEDWLFDRYAPV